MDSVADKQKTVVATPRAKRSRFYYVGRFLTYAILILGAIVFIFPFFWMISSSLMTLGETITRQLMPKVPQWVNYVDAWNQAKFSKYFLNSVLITLGTLAGLLITSILAGYAFGRIDFK